MHCLAVSLTTIISGEWKTSFMIKTKLTIWSQLNLEGMKNEEVRARLFRVRCLESEYSIVQLDEMNIQEIILVVKTLINQRYFLHTV